MSHREPLPPFAIVRPAVSSGTRPAVWRRVAAAGPQRDDLELHVVVRGASTFEAGDSTARPVRAGDILLMRGLAELPSNDAAPNGALTLAARYEACAFVARHQLAALPRVTHLPALTRGVTGTVAKLVALLCESCTEPPRPPRLLVQHLFDALLVALLGASGSSAVAALTPTDPRIARALLLLDDRLHERWTTARMAKVAGMSRAAFALRFARAVGAPPLAHLVRLRMARAAALLVHTDDATSEVARAVGYHSVFAFSRAFKRLTGVPPTVYRRRERQRGPIVACAGAMRLAA